MIALEIFTRLLMFGGLLFLLLVFIAVVAGPGDDYSCAPVEGDEEPEEFDDTAAWDRGHDQWIDEQMEVW